MCQNNGLNIPRALYSILNLEPPSIVLLDFYVPIPCGCLLLALEMNLTITTICYNLAIATHARGVHSICQVEHHVQTKFATPILHGIDNFRNYGIFSTYT